MTDAEPWSVADPFDLPEWVGVEQLQWSTGETRSTALITGTLTGESGTSLGLDLLCVDIAYPAAVVDESRRHDAHQAWHFGQVVLLERADRVAMAVPATRWDADMVLEALRRFAKAIGVPPSQISVLLRL
jgi:hypothetical protein